MMMFLRENQLGLVTYAAHREANMWRSAMELAIEETCWRSASVFLTWFADPFQGFEGETVRIAREAQRFHSMVSTWIR